VAWINWVQTMN